jgi:hypothetical protein
MQFDGQFDDGEPETSTGNCSNFSVVDSEERCEYLSNVFSTNTDAAVGNFHNVLVAFKSTEHIKNRSLDSESDLSSRI